MTSTRETPSPNLTEAVNCPQCGAAVEYPRGAHSIKCRYCGQAIRIPHSTSGGAPRCLLFDTAGALWVTTDDGVVTYQVKQR